MSANEHVVIVDALGIAVGMTTNDPETAARLRRLWSRALTDASPEVYATPLTSKTDTHDHDYATSVQVTVAALQATAGQRLNLHAGAVADPDGRAIAVIGKSGSGKTTAIHALATRLGYLSDETVSVDAELVIYPHPKPLSVITDPMLPGKKESISPDDAGLLVPPEHTTLCRIVLLRRGETTTGLAAISEADAMLDIIPQTSSLVKLENPLLTLATAMARCGGPYALYYTEIEDHVDELIAHLARELDSTELPDHHPAVPIPDHDPGMWSRIAWLDAVAYGDEIVVLIEGLAHKINGLAATVWLALATPATLDEIVAAAIDYHGPHPDAPRLIADTLANLAANEVVSAPASPAE